jgi:hypothetical protein
VVAPGANAGLFLQNQAAAALNQRAKKVAMLEAEEGKLFSYLFFYVSVNRLKYNNFPTYGAIALRNLKSRSRVSLSKP